MELSVTRASPVHDEWSIVQDARSTIDDLVFPLIPWVIGVTAADGRDSERRSAGFLGLVEAAHRFDPSRGPFEPYAKEVARRAMVAETIATSPLPLKGRGRADLRAVREAAAHYDVDLDGHFDLERLAERASLSKDRANAVVGVSRGRVPLAAVAGRLAARTPEDDDAAVVVQMLLDTLPPSERWYVEVWFGIGCDAMSRSQAAACDPFGRTVEQLRYAERTILATLRGRVVELGPMMSGLVTGAAEALAS